MNREDAKKDLYYGIQFDTLKINEFINNIYNNFEKEKESIQKENTRLKKQLANNHHIECMCSFCKPAAESNININKAIITLNNALYFRDNSDYQTALFDALSELTGIKYDDFPNEFMEEK